MRSFSSSTNTLAGIAVGSNSTTLGPFSPVGSIMALSLENTGATALATLALLAKVTPADLNFQTLASGTNWATSNPLVVACSSGLATQGSNSAGWALVRVGGFSVLQFAATVGGTNTTPVNANVAFSDS
jgi:hypothetical protein